MSNAADDVLAERRRQVETEGWTKAHDDQNKNGDMALAGACYACNAATWLDKGHWVARTDYEKLSGPGFRWPWAAEWWKPKNPRRDLVRAAALLIAEIERLDRAAEAVLTPNTKVS